MISEDPISYKNRVIYIETKPVELRIKRQTVIINFNILPLGKDEAVLGIFQLREYNLKIEGQRVIINFNILLLGKNKAVLGMPQLREYNLKIN